jgi:hypothetical protein
MGYGALNCPSHSATLIAGCSQRVYVSSVFEWRNSIANYPMVAVGMCMTSILCCSTCADAVEHVSPAREVCIAWGQVILGPAGTAALHRAAGGLFALTPLRSETAADWTLANCVLEPWRLRGC